jgi:methyltransferase-like protein/trans-aconitate methyltransferase
MASTSVEEIITDLEQSPFSSPAAAPAAPAALNSYDEVPYKSYPYPQTRPERLAAVATLFGMKPAPVDNCRILELGCSSGGNLLPLADRYPNSRMVGIDASRRQIAEGDEFAKRLGLPNIRLEHRDIMDVDQEFGEFDYIICHGVYSWVPANVQKKILSICRLNLAASGVAYVSYNTNPGWHMRGAIRDMMCYRARLFRKPQDRVRNARALLDFLAQAVPAEDNAYGLLLRNELNLLREKEDHYLFHEHLEEVNDPLYFHEFVERAEYAGLQYLGEADFSVMSVQNFPPQIETVLRSFAGDLIETEQYMDFVRNRMFRQTLLTHQDVSLDRSLPPERILGMYVASSAKPEGIVDVRSNAQAVFRGPHAVTTSTEPLVKAALLHLCEIWPQSVPFAELLSIARSRLSTEAVVVDAAHVTTDARRLAEPLLRCYATGQIELSVAPSGFTLQIPERPLASPLARLQAESSNRVTTLRHEAITLSDLQRHVLRYMDGQHDRAALLEELALLVAAGSLVVREEGHRIEEPQRVKTILEKPLGAALSQLARYALICG